MKQNNWTERAIKSEIEYSIARGGILQKYDSFYHISNQYVKYSGDYNRALSLRFNNTENLLHTIDDIKQVHIDNNFDTPDYIDFQGEYDFSEEELSMLKNNGYSVTEALFLSAKVKQCKLEKEFQIYQPDEKEIIEHLKSEQIKYGYYDSNIFQSTDIKLELSFTQKFKPYWLLKNKEPIGSFYLAKIDNYCRLFSVEINEQFQNKGYGKILMSCARNIAFENKSDYILLNTEIKNIKFYEKCDFKICAKIGRIKL